MKRVVPPIIGFFLTLAVLFCGTVSAQSTRFAGSFLELGVGGRAMALGGAYTSIAEDGFAFYWNPAGVATLRRPEVSGMYASLFRSLEKHFHIGYTRPLHGAGAISFNWIRLTVPDVGRIDSENLTRFGPNGFGARINESSNAETWQELLELGTVLTDLPQGFSNFTNDAFIITLAKQNKIDLDFGWQYFVLPITMPIGINLKILRQSLFNRRATGVGFDFGTMLKFGIDDLLNDSRLGKFSLGFTYKDLFNTKMKWDTDTRHSDRIKKSWYLGTSYMQPLPSLKSQLLFVYSLHSKFKHTSHFGLEYLYFDRLAVRFGLDNKQFTAGIGLKLSVFHLDYAFKGHDLGSSHRISTSLQL